MERITRKSQNTDMIWFIDHENNIDLEPCEMQPNHIRLILQKLAYYEDLKEEGRMVILNIEDIHPCKNCGVGWGSISSEGCTSCQDTCVRLKEYNKKISLKKV